MKKKGNIRWGDILLEADFDIVYLTGDGSIVGEDKNYVHDQITPSAEWEIVHSLGKKPSVTVTDSAGTVVTGEVVIVDLTKIIVRFNAPFSGEAILN